MWCQKGHMTLPKVIWGQTFFLSIILPLAVILFFLRIKDWRTFCSDLLFWSVRQILNEFFQLSAINYYNLNVVYYLFINWNSLCILYWQWCRCHRFVGDNWHFKQMVQSLVDHVCWSVINMIHNKQMSETWVMSHNLCHITQWDHR